MNKSLSSVSVIGRQCLPYVGKSYLSEVDALALALCAGLAGVGCRKSMVSAMLTAQPPHQQSDLNHFFFFASVVGFSPVID